MNAFRELAILAAGLLASGQLFAQSCPAGSERVTANLQNFLAGKMVCAAIPGGDRWQEHHQGSGVTASPLVDYKKGPSDLVDPSKQVGTWQASNGADATVTYTYGSLIYTYLVCAVPNIATAASITFVPSGAGTLITGATLFASGAPTACP